MFTTVESDYRITITQTFSVHLSLNQDISCGYMKSHFCLPMPPFGTGQSERVVEIPWSLSWISSGDKVLDLGYAFAEEPYIRALINSPAAEIFGYDVVYNDQKSWDQEVRIARFQGDARQIKCFQSGHFDTILCVSTIEHIGYNNSIYFNESEFEKKTSDDLVVLEQLLPLLRSGGKMIITVPYGKGVDYDWFRQYDWQHLQRLVRHSNCWVACLECFKYENGWVASHPLEMATIEYKGNDAPAAAGVACLLLVKK